MLKRYHVQRKKALDYLGNKCVKCGATQSLDIDHIDPKDKKFPVMSGWSTTPANFESELAKCQLLCRDCHIVKTRQDLGQNNALEVHGTLSSYRYCKCEKCKEAKSLHNKKYYEGPNGVEKLEAKRARGREWHRRKRAAELDTQE
jgi:hypothetical protein